MPFLIIFVIIPFAEIMVFMTVGEHIGFWQTLFLSLLTAIIGGMLVKYQGIQTLMAMRVAGQNGKLPLDEIFDGFCLVAAGAMLITPGFVTDIVGFSLLLPPVRHILKRLIKKHMAGSMSHSPPHTDQSGSASFSDNNIIEGECEPDDDSKS